jgi:oxygen-independent coproporphyrinogen III oxidase
VPHNTRIHLAQQHLDATTASNFGSARGHGPVPGDPVRRLYIHVPFCFHKCHYCDFYSIVDSQDRQAAFTDRLVGELTALSPWTDNQPLHSVFVGGGTPTLLEPTHWRTLLGEMDRLFDLSEIREDGGEFTVECNPETASDELFEVLTSGGVNRLSVGAQSIHPGQLKTLERWHDPANVGKALDLARQHGIERLSLDLIYGVPEQTIEQWAADLASALALGVTHLSCYNLTYEPNTAMTRRLERGEFQPAPEEAEIEMHNLCLATVRAAGLERYEVSNFARMGHECAHNLGYWRQEQWLAAGPSASAHVAGRRWKNVPRLGDYLKRSDAGFSAIIDEEPPDSATAVVERIMTGLRLAEGIDAAQTLARVEALGDAGSAAAVDMAQLAQRHEASGLMRSGERWTLTDAGFLLADGIASEFMALVPR